MSKVNALFWDQFDALAQSYLDQGMDVGDACDRAERKMLGEWVSEDVEVLLAEKEMEGRNV